MTDKQKAATAAKEEQHPSSSGVEVPQGSPPEDSTDKKSSSSKKRSSSKSKRNLFWGVGALLLLTAIVLAITLPLTKDDSSDDSDDNGTSSSALDDIAGGTSTNPTSTNSNGSSGSSQNRTVFGLLPLFGQVIIGGYENASEVQADLTVALQRDAMAFIEQQIQWNQGYEYNPDGDKETQVTDTDESSPMPPTAEAGAAQEMATMDDGAGDSSASVTDFETNNQEDNVDEADIIKADANFVYAAYGDYIVVWATNGTQVATIKMPEIELPEGWGEDPPKPETTYYDEAEAAQAEAEPETEEAEPLTETASSRSSIMYDPYYRPKPNIASLLLTDNHLVAFVTGYNQRYYGYYGGPQPADDMDEMPILQGYRQSQIRLYRKTATGNLTFVGSQDVNGYLVDARSMGDNVHIATSTSIDIYSHLYDALNFYNFPRNITLDEYRQQAMDMAEQEYIPKMTRKLTEELGLEQGELPQMLRINQWMTNPEPEPETDGEDIIIGPDSYDVVRNVATVTSFNVNDQNTLELTTSSSQYLAPNSFSTLYGTQDKLVLATQGWDWSTTFGGGGCNGEQKTYLVALEVSGPATSFISVGTLQGHLLNQYALDIVDNAETGVPELRAATTVERNSWGWWGCIGGGGPMPDEVVMFTDPMSRQGDIKQDACPEVDEPCMNEENRAQCIEVLETGCMALSTMESCPLQFACADENTNSEEVDSIPIPPPEEQEDQDRTDNYMTVLALVGDTEGQMEFKGSVNIGEPNERIMSVRFFDDVAYAVTFEQTDPFYVLDMSVPTVLGSLKLPGFSSYLHSMNDDNTMLVGVGQNATADGRTTGVMVTVFDATDPANPKDVVSHTFETGSSGSSSSDIQWDYKAFRLVGSKLIMPMSIYYYESWDPNTGQVIPRPEGLENFEGFVVLDVTETAITEEYRISHNPETGSCRCYYSSLPSRSFVYSGDLMTVRGNTVVSTVLDSGIKKWTLRLAVEGETNTCCPYYY